jgi:hypothetical protein
MSNKQVFDKEHSGSPALTVLDKAGHQIENNAYAASITIWNAGNAEIAAADLRKPFHLVVSGNSRVIDIAPTFFFGNYPFYKPANTGSMTLS